MRILLVRPETAGDADLVTLRSRGWSVTHEPYLVVRTRLDSFTRNIAATLTDRVEAGDCWVIVTSGATVRSWVDLVGADVLSAAFTQGRSLGTRFAAVGPASARALADLGAVDVLQPTDDHTAVGLAALLPDSGAAVLPHGSLASPWLRNTLVDRGWQVDSGALYDTTPSPDRPASARSLAAGEYDVLVLRSPSAARAVIAAAGAVPARTVIVAGGPTTRAEAERLGLLVSAESTSSTPDSLAAAIDRAVQKPLLTRGA